MRIAMDGEPFAVHITNENTRNSEGAFYRFRDGRLLFAHSRFRAGGEDWNPSDIGGWISEDNGRTWKDAGILVSMEEEGLSSSPEQGALCPQNLCSVSFLEMAKGDCGLFYSVRKSFNDLSLYLRRSSDGGKTFGPSLRLAAPLGYNASLNDSVVRLSSGRILIPMYVPRTREEYKHPEEGGQSLIDRVFAWHSSVYYLISDDDGLHWRESAESCHVPVSWSTGLTEPGVTELSPGLLWSWARTDLGFQYEMFSHDGGDSWTEPRPARYFPSAVSPMRVCRIPDGSLCAVWNPVPVTFDERFEQVGAPVSYSRRSPLVLVRSTDNGKSWLSPKVLDAIPDGIPGSVEYPALFPLEDVLLVAYNRDSDLILGRIPYESL